MKPITHVAAPCSGPLLRSRLEQIWETPGVCCPHNIVRWSFDRVGWTKYEEIGMFYTRGKRLVPKRNKTKGKGWTILSRNYGIALYITKRKAAGLEPDPEAFSVRLS